MKCQRVLLEILGMPTAKTFEREWRHQNIMVRFFALLNVEKTHSTVSADGDEQKHSWLLQITKAASFSLKYRQLQLKKQKQRNPKTYVSVLISFGKHISKEIVLVFIHKFGCHLLIKCLASCSGGICFIFICVCFNLQKSF